MSQKVNVNAYFERIGFAGSIAPTLATLETILGLHVAAIPFENLNPFLGLPVDLDLKAIEKKLLAEQRGGYCFEHNLLLGAVLRELDYPVRNLAARVLRNDPDPAEATHMLLLVDITGTTYLVDAGFGGSTPSSPLKLRADSEQTTPHDIYRLTGGQQDWLLETRAGDAWKALYRFDTVEKSAEDFASINLALSARPDSPFVQELRVALASPGKRLKLWDNRLTTHVTGEAPETLTLSSVDELRDVLSGTFGIQLPAAELLDPKLEGILLKPTLSEH
ncbi:MAG TPA: arylamine N-acetyltransferase [Devosia sp.]|jgi:N-hydroxyarylamine O-acetyltransferase|uniref:arylamine N-acetyltransferase family protein n=1 Tax=Devosia sp. TaxID=1871048 RepID=UPI002F958995